MILWYPISSSFNLLIRSFTRGSQSARPLITTLPSFLHGASGVNVGDSVIWIMGGYNSVTDIKEVWIYNITDHTFTLTDSLPLERSYQSSVNVGGCIYSVGGNNNNAPQVTTELLQNCAPIFLGVAEKKPESSRPYSITSSTSEFQLLLKKNAGGEHAAIKLIDMQGRTVITRSSGSDGKITLYAAEVSPGKYIVVVAIDRESFLEKWSAANY